MKSEVFFSSNVRRDKQMEISAILGVHGDISSSNYLDLPFLIGRSKKWVFAFSKERVCKRIDSWKSKPISRARKLILIKNVAQSIPSHCMTCFLLPKTLTQKVERLFSVYWWSSTSVTNKGVRWLS